MPKIILRIILLFAILEIAFAAPSIAKEIKIGVLATLTGPTVGYGHQQVAAINLAVDQINKEGGICGIPIKIVIIDTAGYPYKAASFMHLMAIKERAVAVLDPCPSLSEEWDQVLHIANKLCIPVIAASALDPWSRIKYGLWDFHTNTTREKVQMDGISKWASSLGIRSIVTVFDRSIRTTHSESTILFPKILKQLGIKSSGELSFLKGDLNFIDQILYVKKMNPHGVIINGHPFDIVNIARELKDHKFKGSIYSAGPLFPQLNAADIDSGLSRKLYFGTPFWINKENNSVVKFIKNIKWKSKMEFVYPATAQLYDVVYAIKDILERSGISSSTKKNREAIMHGLTKLRNFPGVAGAFSIYPDGHVEREVYLIGFIDGYYRLIN